MNMAQGAHDKIPRCHPFGLTKNNSNSKDLQTALIRRKEESFLKG